MADAVGSAANGRSGPGRDHRSATAARASAGGLTAAALSGLALPGEADAAFVAESTDFSDDPGTPTDLRSGGSVVDFGLTGDGLSGSAENNVSDEDYVLVLSPTGQPVTLDIQLSWNPPSGPDVEFGLVDGTDFASTPLFFQSFPSGSSGSQTFSPTVTSSTGTIGVLARAPGFEGFNALIYEVQAPEPSTGLYLGLAVAAAAAGRRLLRKPDRER